MFQMLMSQRVYKYLYYTNQYTFLYKFRISGNGQRHQPLTFLSLCHDLKKNLCLYDLSISISRSKKEFVFI